MPSDKITIKDQPPAERIFVVNRPHGSSTQVRGAHSFDIRYGSLVFYVGAPGNLIASIAFGPGQWVTVGVPVVQPSI